MQNYDNELTIYRGESFTLDFKVQYESGAPYIVSSEAENPYWLISISDSALETGNRDVRNYWLPVDNKNKYASTLPLDLYDFKTYATGDKPAYASFSDVKSFPISGVYYNGQYVESLSAKHAVFYNSLEPGTYKYWDNGWKDYDCRIVCPFRSADTSTLEIGKYYYSIQFITGISTLSYLRSLVSENTELTSEQIKDLDVHELYDLVKNVSNLPSDLHLEQPIFPTSSNPIMAPNVINVISYMQGDIRWTTI